MYCLLVSQQFWLWSTQKRKEVSGVDISPQEQHVQILVHIPSTHKKTPSGRSFRSGPASFCVGTPFFGGRSLLREPKARSK